LTKREHEVDRIFSRGSAQIASFASEYNEQSEKLGQLKSRLEEHQSQKHEISLALAAARRECEQRKGFTKSEAFGLEREWQSSLAVAREKAYLPRANCVEEFKSLQSFNSWRLEKLTSTGIELVYDEEIQLTASCSDSQPSAASCQLVLKAKKGQDMSATQGLFDLMKPVVENAKASSSFQGVGTATRNHNGVEC